ncbi:MAG: PAS domain-containing protein [Planctomycetes bacterium]|nr:PAS domain-containing protein [Planctomycetota bacterium]
MSQVELAQRQRAEVLLLKSEERLSLTLNAVSDGAWDWDVPSDRLSFSEGWLSSLGYSSDELPARMSDWEALLHVDDLQRVREAREAHLAGETPSYECEGRLRTKSGDYRFNLGRGKVVVRNEAGEPVRMVGTDTDVTVRHQEAAEQAALLAKIQQSQKLESLGVVVGGIAHDFNNLLAGILGSAQIARRELPAGSGVQEHLKRIKAASNRAAELTRQMLAYAGRGSFDLARVDLSEIATELPRLVSASLSKKAQLVEEFEPGAFVKGDPSQLRQVVMNLLINASDALAGEAGTIAIRTGRVDLDSEALEKCLLGRNRLAGTYAFLEVEDSGMGMAPDTLAKIFDPFFSTKASGRGLGLAAVIGIARWHQGVVQAESTLGEGTVIRVLLPAGEPPNSPDVNEGDEQPEAGVALSGTALVVDDEQEVREVLVASLELMGLSCLVAEDGQAGLSMFREHRAEISLVIVDMTMPHMSGVELAEALRGEASDLPIVMVSGYAEPKDVASIPRAQFLAKPFELEPPRRRPRGSRAAGGLRVHAASGGPRWLCPLKGCRSSGSVPPRSHP